MDQLQTLNKKLNIIARIPPNNLQYTMRRDPSCEFIPLLITVSGGTNNSLDSHGRELVSYIIVLLARMRPAPLLSSYWYPYSSRVSNGSGIIIRTPTDTPSTAVRSRADKIEFK